MLLADKKRLGRPFWTFTLDELRSLMGVADKKSYERWNNFRQWVLDPALAAVNDYGTVKVSMTPEKQGRSVHAVTFRWHWKDPHDAAVTASKNERHSVARRRQQKTADAPPMMIEDRDEAARLWWEALDQSTRNKWADRIGRTFKAAGKDHSRPERILRRMAFDVAHPKAFHDAKDGAPRNKAVKR